MNDKLRIGKNCKGLSPKLTKAVLRNSHASTEENHEEYRQYPILSFNRAQLEHDSTAT
jgi:hypothetical protein